jgi:hypothetical protein
MVTSGSMSGAGRRSDGLLGQSGSERRRSRQPPPALYATALDFDSTDRKFSAETSQAVLTFTSTITDTVFTAIQERRRLPFLTARSGAG